MAEPALEAMAIGLWTEKQSREVARQQRVRTDRKVQAAVEGLEVLTPELQAEVTAERTAAARRPHTRHSTGRARVHMSGSTLSVARIMHGRIANGTLLRMFI